MLSMVAASFLFSVISSTNFAATKYVKCITFCSPKHFPSRKTRHWSSNVKTLIRELFCHAGMSAHRVLSQQLFDGFENWISLTFIVLRWSLLTVETTIQCMAMKFGTHMMSPSGGLVMGLMILFSNAFVRSIFFLNLSNTCKLIRLSPTLRLVLHANVSML